MKITCPACGFNRDVPPKRIPGPSVTATCPKCGEKFKVKLPNNEEEEDIRQVAARAYEEESKRFENGDEELYENPWELAPWPSGWFSAFFQTVYRVMFSPARFYAYLLPAASLIRPLAFFSIIILFQSIVDRLWGQLLLSMLSPGAMTDPQLEELLKLFSSEENFFLNVLFRFGTMVFQLYLYTAILFATYRLLTPKKTGFEKIFQIMAYSYAPLLLCVIPVLGSLTGMIWSLACFLIGIKTALHLNWTRTILGLSPIIILTLPALSLVFNMIQ